jgi:acetylglutamate kinase
MRDLSDPSSLVPRCSPSEIGALIESGVIKGGMLPKVQNCLQAIKSGVRQVSIIDGTGERSTLAACLAGENAGTTIAADR